MKRVICLIIIIMTIFNLCACRFIKPDPPVVTPTASGQQSADDDNAVRGEDSGSHQNHTAIPKPEGSNGRPIIKDPIHNDLDAGGLPGWSQTGVSDTDAPSSAPSPSSEGDDALVSALPTVNTTPAAPTPTPKPTSTPTPKPTATPKPTPQIHPYPTDADEIRYAEAGKKFMKKLKSMAGYESLDIRARSGYPYLIAINKAQYKNTVTVFCVDDEGNYTRPYLSMVCSAGNDTPQGIFNTKNRYSWHTLVGPCYGQYCTRIVGGVLFHSVPYATKHKYDLKYTYYNKLGRLASAGCIRLPCNDSKWIYDNCPLGTTVVIYTDTSSAGPLGQPTPLSIDVNDVLLRSWDPTDPDKANPWGNGFKAGYTIRSQIAMADYEYAISHGLWDGSINHPEAPTPTPPGFTPSPMPTGTPAPTETPSPSYTPVPTDTPKPTDTPTPTDTPRPTDTPTPTDTPSPPDTSKPTDTPYPTDTPKPSSTPAVKPTKVPTPDRTYAP